MRSRPLGYASTVRSTVAALWVFVGCATPPAVPITPTSNDPSSTQCSHATALEWTIPPRDLSTLPEPSLEPIVHDDLWFAEFPSAVDVRLREVRLAVAPPTRGDGSNLAQLAWVAVVPRPAPRSLRWMGCGGPWRRTDRRSSRPRAIRPSTRTKPGKAGCRGRNGSRPRIGRSSHSALCSSRRVVRCCHPAHRRRSRAGAATPTTSGRS